MQELEEYVAQGGDEAARLHLDACTICSEKATEIRQNNRLLRELSSLGKAPGPRSAAPVLPVVEGYEIIASIGHGSQGLVYKAIQLTTKRSVAIKVISGGHYSGSRQRHRFEREVELAAGLRHPNIVTVFDSGVCTDGRLYCVMEFIEGAPLDRDLERALQNDRRGKNIDILLRMFLKICGGVKHAHLRGVIHRDLKPGNILIDSVGEPRIVDFGLAKLAEDEANVSVLQTREGEFAGTIAYASPEQTRGVPGDIDTRSDIYSLGVILFEMLTGELPSPLSGPMSEMLRVIAESPPRLPSAFNPDINADLETILLKSLSKDPARRYQSAGNLANDIENYLKGEAIDARRDSTWYVFRKTVERHRVPVTVALTLVGMLAAFSVIVWIAYQRTIVAEAAATNTAQELDRALSISNIERGRMMASRGNTFPAEDMLWREQVKEESRPNYDPKFAPARWALRELYWQQPILVSTSIPKSDWLLLSGNARTVVLQRSGHGPAEIWDVHAGKCIKTISLFEAKEWSGLSLSAEGRFLAVKSKTEVLMIDLESEIVVGRLAADADWVGISIATDTRHIALIQSNLPGRIRLYSLPDLRFEREIDAHKGEVDTFVFSPDGKMLASVGREDKTVNVWDSHSGELLRTVAGEKEGASSVRFNSKGELFCIWRARSGGEFINVKEGTIRAADSMIIPDSLFPAIRFRSDNRLMALKGNNAIALYSIHDNSVRRIIGGAVDRSEMSNDGSQLVTVSLAERMIQEWDLNVLASTAKLSLNNPSARPENVDPTRPVFAAQSADPNSVEFRDTHTGELLHKRTFEAPVKLMGYSKSGALAVLLNENTIQLLDDYAGPPVATLPKFERMFFGCRFSPDGKFLATAAADHIVRLWSARTGESVTQTQAIPGGISELRYDADGRYLAVGGLAGIIHLLDPQTLNEIGTLRAHTAAVRGLTFMDGGRTLVSSSLDTSVRVWDLATRTCTKVLSGHASTVGCVDVNRDDTLVVSGDGDGEVRVWRLSDQRCLATFKVSDEAITSVHFSESGDELYCSTIADEFKIDLNQLDRYIDGNSAFWRSRLAGPK